MFCYDSCKKLLVTYNKLDKFRINALSSHVAAAGGKYERHDQSEGEVPPMPGTIHRRI
jgi:hypothetical protein